MRENAIFERPREIFKAPDIFAEQGEFERVAKKLHIDSSVLMFQAQNAGKMEILDEKTWERLENTDSFTIPVDGHGAAEDLSRQAGRNYRAVAEAIYSRQIDAPIILRRGEHYHLVSGNTRLMACRAYGLVPNVWIFEVD